MCNLVMCRHTCVIYMYIIICVVPASLQQARGKKNNLHKCFAAGLQQTLICIKLFAAGLQQTLICMVKMFAAHLQHIRCKLAANTASSSINVCCKSAAILPQVCSNYLQEGDFFSKGVKSKVDIMIGFTL